MLESSGLIPLEPGGYTYIFQQGPSSQVLCRFTGTTPSKSAATMTVYPWNSSDGSDTVVVPAH